MLKQSRLLQIGTLFYIIISSVLIYYHNGYLIDDAVIYWSKANEFPNLIYPSSVDFNSDFIWHPMVINISRCILSLGGSLKTVQLLNVLFSIGIIYLLRSIAFKLFSERISLLTFLICLAYPNFYIWNLALSTEIYFLFFLLLIINVYYSEIKLKFLFLGALIPILDYSRELGLIVIMIYFIGLLWDIKKYRKIGVNSYNILLFSIGFAVINFSIGAFHKYKTGYFWTKGSVLGYNIINGAAGDHIGENNHLATQKGSLGYIDNAHSRSFFYKDSVWKRRGFDFLFNHPVEFVKPFPRKLVKLFLHDLAFVNFAYEKNSWYQMAKDYRNGTSNVTLIVNYVHLWSLNLWFYILLGLELIGIWMVRRYFDKYLLIVLLGLTILFLPLLFQTQPRYHTPTFVLFIPFVAVSCELFHIIRRFCSNVEFD